MKNNVEQTVKVDDNQIGAVAYQLWEQAGRPSGRDQEFWFKAETQVRTIVKSPLPAPAARLAPTPTAKAVSRVTPAPDRNRPIAPSVASTPPRNRHSRGFAAAMK